MSGVIEELFVPDGEKVTAGAQLCRINTSGSAASQPAATETPPTTQPEAPPTTTPPPQAEAAPTPIPTSPPPPPPLPGQQKKHAALKYKPHILVQPHNIVQPIYNLVSIRFGKMTLSWVLAEFKFGDLNA